MTAIGLIVRVSCFVSCFSKRGVDLDSKDGDVKEGVYYET